MKITLYRDCVVRDTYSRVFSPTVFEDYLATLTKTDFDIDSSYAIMGGSFSFDWGIVNAASPYVYNYMKIDDDDNDIMFYAFINRVDLANGCVVISYTNDIWHTFIGGCRMYDSLVNQSKHTPTGKYHFLPIDYLTNERLNWTSLEEFETIGMTPGTDSLIMAIEAQIYNTRGSGAGASERFPFVMFTEILNRNSQGFCSIKEAEAFLSVFLTRQGQNKTPDDWVIYFNNQAVSSPIVPKREFENVYGDAGFTFEVINIFYLRKSWMTRFFNKYTIKENVFLKKTGVPVKYEPYYFEYDNPITGLTDSVMMYTVFQNLDDPSISMVNIAPNGDLYKLKDYEIPVNYKITGIGPYTTVMSAQNNGTTNTMSLLCSVSNFGFRLYLNIYGQMFEITEFFKLNVPFTAINGETAQLRRLADEEKRDKAITKMVTGTISGIGKEIQNWTGTSSGTRGAAVANKIGGTLQNIAKTTETIVTAAIDIKTANASKYQTNYGQDVESDSAINIYYGLGYFTLAAVDNQEEVDFAIDNYGYSMGVVPTTDLPYNPFNLESGYNPTSYSRINLFGSCPQNTLNQLEGILIKGTKIYYSLEEVNGSTN